MGTTVSPATAESEVTQLLTHDETRTGAIAPGVVLRQRYRLENEIGRGGMGVVYRATDLELKRPVAIKLLSESAFPEARERLMREARAAAALNHPHIISVHDVGESEGTPFLVMELVLGPSLAKAPPTELSAIVEIASQICTALDHAHSSNIVHRDLKPENVLLSGSGAPSVKLADLGLALPGYGARISRSGLIVGTASYMAPEQALGQKVDGRTDLYALGVLLYQLTTGRLPFAGDNPLAVVSQHVHAPVVPPRVLRPELPRKLEEVILRLLQKNPVDRYSSARETAAALADSLALPGSVEESEAVDSVAILDALSRGRFVGRVPELAEARELWRHAREGRGHAVLFSGEPGAGKTRLARELTIQAAVDGAIVLRGGCYEYEATTPYLPFVEAFRRWVREQKDDAALQEALGDSASQIAKLAPEIESRLGPFPAPPELPPHEERLLFFDAVAQVFANLAKQSGLLFYADDLHWADRSTLWLLAHLLRQTREHRVLIVGCYRETELDRSHALAKALVDWNRERLITRITLRRFDGAETSAQLSALLGEEVSAEFGTAVHRETEGNPFFVEEVLKALIEQGSLHRESGRWKRCDVHELVIPQSVKEAIGNRLNRVSAQTNEVLRAAAVLGKSFRFEELKATAGKVSEDALLDALDESTGAQLIVAGNDDSFTFTHDKIREVLYEELNPIRRRRLHRNAAEGLERHCGPGGCAVERLAYHYIHAGEYEHGLKYAKQAAREAVRVFAFDEAVAAYSRALECAEALGLADEQRTQEELIGKVYMLHGETIAAGEHFERALSFPAEPQVRARLQVHAAGSLVATGDQRGLDYIRDALAVLDPQINPLETANALSTEGRFHHLAGRHMKAIDLLQRAAHLVEPIVAADSLPNFAAPIVSRIYSFLAGANQHYGLYTEADRWARKAVDFGTAHNVLFAQAAGFEFLSEDAIHAGNFKAGLEYADQEFELIEKLQSRERKTWACFAAGMCSFLSGDSARAEREFTEGLALAEFIGERRASSLLKGNLAVLLADKAKSIEAENTARRQQLLDEALKLALENFQESENLNLLYSRFEGHRCLAEVRFRRGELDEAERVCAVIAELLSETDSRVCKLWLGPLYMDVLLAEAEEADDDVKPDIAAAKRRLALSQLESYEQLVALCESPRFTREAERLAEVLSRSTAAMSR
jgi:tetratricopeptide (TPR) repeat protein